MPIKCVEQFAWPFYATVTLHSLRTVKPSLRHILLVIEHLWAPRYEPEQNYSSPLYYAIRGRTVINRIRGRSSTQNEETFPGGVWIGADALCRNTRIVSRDFDRHSTWYTQKALSLKGYLVRA